MTIFVALNPSALLWYGGMTDAATGSMMKSYSFALGKYSHHGELIALPYPILFVDGDTNSQNVSNVCLPLVFLFVCLLQGRAILFHGLPHAHCSAEYLNLNYIDISFNHSATIGHERILNFSTASSFCRTILAGFNPGFLLSCDIRRALSLTISHGIAIFVCRLIWISPHLVLFFLFFLRKASFAIQYQRGKHALRHVVTAACSVMRATSMFSPGVC